MGAVSDVIIQSNFWWIINDLVLIMKIRIAVIGAGIFGLTTAIKLSENGYQVTVLEKENDIMQCASGINQYRIHRGYHYPRSLYTSQTCKESSDSFVASFPEAVIAMLACGRIGAIHSVVFGGFA